MLYYCTENTSSKKILGHLISCTMGTGTGRDDGYGNAYGHRSNMSAIPGMGTGKGSRPWVRNVYGYGYTISFPGTGTTSLIINAL